MSAAITVTPSSGTAEMTVFYPKVTGLDANDATAYDNTKYPSEPELTYYVRATATGEATLKSVTFAPNPDGTAAPVPEGWVLSNNATWTFSVRKTSDDSSVATVDVVAS